MATRSAGSARTGAAKAGEDGADNSATRAALLDAAERVMLADGYAAVTTRRIAAEAEANQGLVYYYFGSMENLFVELFRRGAERSYARQVQALDGPQPLWALWDAVHEQSASALTMEFVALANHRKNIRAEIAGSSQRFRTLQLDAVTRLCAGYGYESDVYTPATIVLLMSSVSRFLRMEEDFGVDTGHAEVVALIEGVVRGIEGERAR